MVSAGCRDVSVSRYVASLGDSSVTIIPEPLDGECRLRSRGADAYNIQSDHQDTEVVRLDTISVGVAIVENSWYRTEFYNESIPHLTHIRPLEIGASCPIAKIYIQTESARH